jgi:hypothetical protein
MLLKIKNSLQILKLRKADNHALLEALLHGYRLCEYSAGSGT